MEIVDIFDFLLTFCEKKNASFSSPCNILLFTHSFAMTLIELNSLLLIPKNPCELPTNFIRRNSYKCDIPMANILWAWAISPSATLQTNGFTLGID